MEEQWTRPRGGLMLGGSRTVQGDSLVDFEQVEPAEFESVAVTDSSSWPSMLLKVAINGARSPGEHPALPLHPAELAASSAAALGAGAGAVHLHVRRPDGQESLDPGDVDAALAAVRAACGAAPLGVSTGAWIVPDPAARLAGGAGIAEPA